MKNFIFGALLATILIFAYQTFYRVPSPIQKNAAIDSEAQPKVKNKKEVARTSQALEIPKPSPQQNTQNITETDDSIEKLEELKLNSGKLDNVDISSLNKEERLLLLKKMKSYNPNHPGRIEELPPGTELEDGTIVGQEEALLFFDVFEKELAERLSELSENDLRSRFAEELSWFQRVGNFRKRQKCEALNAMQKYFKLPKTSRNDCIKNIIVTEKETWNL